MVERSAIRTRTDLHSLHKITTKRDQSAKRADKNTCKASGLRFIFFLIIANKTSSFDDIFSTTRQVLIGSQSTEKLLKVNAVLVSNLHCYSIEIFEEKVLTFHAEHLYLDPELSPGFR